MNWNNFRRLPDDARVWISGFERPLGPAEQETVRAGMERFAAGWASHQVPVESAFEIVQDRFLVIAACTSGSVSGCSIDSMMRNMRDLYSTVGVAPPAGNLIYFRDETGRIQSIDHLEFRDVADSGRLKPDTRVFDTLIQNLGQLRAGRFELPYQEAWHARAFPLPVTA